MKISERYSVARNTSNLKSEPRTRYSSSDVVGAAGAAAQKHDGAVAMLLWECAYRGKTQSKVALVELLGRDLLGFMMRAKIDGDPRLIAKEVLAWYLHGTCKPCSGRGYELIPGTPTLSDRLCKSCKGTKKLPLPRTEAHDWLHDRMSKLAAIAGGKVMRKIADDMKDF